MHGRGYGGVREEHVIAGESREREEMWKKRGGSETERVWEIEETESGKERGEWDNDLLSSVSFLFFSLFPVHIHVCMSEWVCAHAYSCLV